MKIAIIGHGHIGAGLGRAWAKQHTVVFAARNLEDAALVALCKSSGASAVALRNAAQESDVIVLAVPFTAIDSVLTATGELAGRIVIDCTNAVERGMSLKYGHTTSAAEELQKKIPKARVFKSFNAQGAENLADPVYSGVRATNFHCGDDEDGKRVLKQLIEEVGFEAVDAGPLKNARLLEPMMLLWVACAQATGSRDIAFKLLRR